MAQLVQVQLSGGPVEHQPQWRHRSSTGLLPWPVHKDGAVQFPGCEKFHPASEGAKTYPSRPSGRYLTEYLTSKGHTIAERQSFTTICSSNTSSPSAGLDHRLRYWRAIRTAPLACPAHRVPQSTPKPFQRTSQLPPASSPDRRDREKDEQKKGASTSRPSVTNLTTRSKLPTPAGFYPITFPSGAHSRAVN